MAETIRRATAPLAGQRYVRDIPVAPEALVIRLRGAINNPPKRMFGVLKVGPQWVGVVSGSDFVVWEKQGHATRATGRITARRGGSRVEAEIAVSRRARVMSVVFFALFIIASFGILTREGALGVGPAGLAVAAAGAVVTLTLFWSASVRQTAALAAFLDAVFREREPA